MDARDYPEAYLEDEQEVNKTELLIENLRQHLATVTSERDEWKATADARTEHELAVSQIIHALKREAV